MALNVNNVNGIKEKTMKTIEIDTSAAAQYKRIKAHLHLVGYGSDEYKKLKTLLDYYYRKINQ